MSDLGLGAWLTLGAVLVATGLLAAAVRRDRGGMLAGLVLVLAAVVVDLAALVRFAVLPSASLATLLVILVLGGVLLLLVEQISRGEEEP
jgi:hypothetical protein